MRSEELRVLVMQALKQERWSVVGEIIDKVAVLQTRLSGKTVPRPSLPSHPRVQPGDGTRIIEIIWSFIIQGVLVPGSDDPNPSWPHLHLTEYGRKCLAEDRFLPHDPDGFLTQFQSAIPTADPVILEYLTESLQCFLRGLHRAAAVMLGGASEKAVLLLIESLGNAIANQQERERFLRAVEKAPTIFCKYKLFETRFSKAKPALPRELRENLDSLLRGVFDLIRNSRNDAGHPASGVVVDRDIVYSHLRLFVPYATRIYDLIDWLAKNPVWTGPASTEKPSATFAAKSRMPEASHGVGRSCMAERWGPPVEGYWVLGRGTA